MNGSRLADTDSTKLMSMSGPMASTMSLAISTSKPSTSPDVGFFRPKPGWSNFTPTVIDPASAMRAIVVPASNVGSVASDVVVSSVAVSSSSPQAAAPTRRATPIVNARIFLAGFRITGVASC